MIEKKINDKIEDTVAAAELHNATFAEPEAPEPVMQTSLDSALAEPVTTALCAAEGLAAGPLWLLHGESTSCCSGSGPGWSQGLPAVGALSLGVSR